MQPELAASQQLPCFEDELTVCAQLARNRSAEVCRLHCAQLSCSIYRGPYIDLLHQLAKTHMGALPKGNTSFTKEQDRELIVRFFAMHNSLNKFKPPLSRFLNNEMQEHRYMDTDTIQDYTKLFSRTIKLVGRCSTMIHLVSTCRLCKSACVSFELLCRQMRVSRGSCLCCNSAVQHWGR